MAKLRREKGIEFVIETPGNAFYNVAVSRIVPAGDCAAYMKAEVRYADNAQGDYDAGCDPVMTVEGVDTLDLQCILKEMCEEVAQLTNVHVQ